MRRNNRFSQEPFIKPYQILINRPSATTPYYDIPDCNMDYFHEHDTNKIKDETLKHLHVSL